MKRPIVNFLTSAILTGALCLGLPAGLPAQEPAQTPEDQGASQARDNGQATGQATQYTFAGKISKSNRGKFLLEDPSKGVSFILDNASMAKKFVGKNVVVTGTLDQTNNILHVKKIELAA